MKKTGFFAYPSNPLSLVVSVNRAIKNINTSGYDIEVKGWEENSVTGSFVIKKVCKAIDEADVFLCDLTYINENVLFELGYAIASDRRIWISVDKSIRDEKQFTQELDFLTTIGYRSYTNAEVLSSQFLADEPFESTQDTLYQPRRKTPTFRCGDIRRPPQGEIALRFALKCAILSLNSVEQLATQVCHGMVEIKAQRGSLTTAYRRLWRKVRHVKYATRKKRTGHEKSLNSQCIGASTH